MAQVVLADEINRATPKTQSALLECMEERQATIDGTSYKMPDPFLVIATQNPIEYEGTFALPEAQLDRFMLRIRLGYPSPADEQTIIDQQKITHPLDDLKEVLSLEELRALQAAVREVYVDPAVADYIVRLVNATRTHPDVYLGASPRGSLALYRAGQALAALAGRDYVIPDDVKVLAEAALAHRLIIKTSSSMHDIDPRQVVAELLNTVPVDQTRVAGSERRGPAEDLPARAAAAKRRATGSPAR
jgi:MoxR-like ATPase